jgi:nitrite reductase/ring-hydroxylating ferredoxin subunit
MRAIPHHVQPALRGYRFPFTPFPTGWYALGRDDDFRPMTIRTLHRFGYDLVVFRSAAGRLGVLDAVCPHLGAHLGGGAVRGEEIVCPFHGFAFATDGRRVTATGRMPQLACRAWPTRVVDGFVLVYHDPSGAAPTWEIPSKNPDGWRPIRTQTWRVRTHPQETSENGVDLDHLRAVHHYVAVEAVSPPRPAGPRLSAQYGVTRRSPPGMRHRTFIMEFTVELHGLGYSAVDLAMPELGMRYRLWVLSTPIDGEHVDYRLGLSMADSMRRRAVQPALMLLPRPLGLRLVEWLAFKIFRDDAELDFAIWETKGYRATVTDDPIRVYRRWATQFYGDGVE